MKNLLHLKNEIYSTKKAPLLFSSFHISNLMQDLARNELNSHISMTIDAIIHWKSNLQEIEKEYPKLKKSFFSFYKSFLISENNKNDPYFESTIIEIYIESKEILNCLTHRLAILEMICESQKSIK